MNRTGYWIVEPEAIEGWLGTVKNKEFLVALLSWLVIQFRKEFETKYPLLHFEVVRSEYIGVYPAIGVVGATEGCDHIEDQIEVLTKKLLDERSLRDFIQYVLGGDVVWSDMADELLSTPAK